MKKGEATITHKILNFSWTFGFLQYAKTMGKKMLDIVKSNFFRASSHTILKQPPLSMRIRLTCHRQECLCAMSNFWVLFMICSVCKLPSPLSDSCLEAIAMKKWKRCYMLRGFSSSAITSQNKKKEKEWWPFFRFLETFSCGCCCSDSPVQCRQSPKRASVQRWSLLAESPHLPHSRPYTSWT